jgi:dTDP-glucose 4,6-dehydratase
VRRACEEGRHRITVLDALTYAGNPENLAGLEASAGYRFVHGSICDASAVASAMEGCEAVINLAAETHVDRSIRDARAFLDTNVGGVHVLLEAVRERGIRLVHVSTDEVYGSVGEGRVKEDASLSPSSPYAASKAAGDLLVYAYVRTYGVDAVVTRCGNNYGPRQFPEKLIPLLITEAMEDRDLPLYGDGLQVRDWIHVEDHCRALETILERGQRGAVYHVSAGCEVTNRDVCALVLGELGKPWSLVRHVLDRPGHDRRYALDAGRLRSELGWHPQVEFAKGLRQTVEWYRQNRGWWERVKTGSYSRYYAETYGHRLADAARPRATGKTHD